MVWAADEQDSRSYSYDWMIVDARIQAQKTYLSQSNARFTLGHQALLNPLLFPTKTSLMFRSGEINKLTVVLDGSCIEHALWLLELSLKTDKPCRFVLKNDKKLSSVVR